MLVGMVLAEQEFCSGGQLGANTCSSAASIAPISPGQFWVWWCWIDRSGSPFYALTADDGSLGADGLRRTELLLGHVSLSPGRCVRRLGKMGIRLGRRRYWWGCGPHDVISTAQSDGELRPQSPCRRWLRLVSTLTSEGVSPPTGCTAVARTLFSCISTRPVWIHPFVGN